MEIKVKYLIFIICCGSILCSSTILRSMALPGWGEAKEYKIHSKEYIKKRSNTFMLVECAVLLSYITTNTLSDSYTDDYENYGVMHAGINWSGKNDIYAINVGKHDSMTDFNLYKIEQGREDETYPSNQGYDWSWNSSAIRKDYANVRNKSEQMNDLAVFMIAGMLINRAASVFDIISIKKNEGSFLSFNIDADKENTNLSFSYNF